LNPVKLIVSTFTTPAGWLEVEYDEHYIYRAAFTENSSKSTVAIEPKGQLGTLIAEQLDAYLHNPHHRFQLPLKPLGSPYQQKVWNALLVIPVGRTITYGELATKLQSSPRAIGQACKKNPLTLFIPCHRVVGKNDQGGYMGCVDALPYKLALLQHES
jgi:methylated-DNA-[protein]-cysteine S-methyltransferase